MLYIQNLCTSYPKWKAAKMFKLSAIFLILVFDVTLEYELKCPDSGEWRLRAVGFNCSIISQYVCLFRYPERAYNETCDGLDYSSTGSKLIYEPFFNKAYCSYERYQPFPFSTDGSSKCLYQKSFCNEKGQYVFQKGSIRSDISCGCDLTRGYEFINMPKHECYCIPSEEDCSCHKVPCNDLVEQCLRDGDESITRPLFTPGKENRFHDVIQILYGKKYRLQCVYITAVSLAVMIMIVTLFFTFIYVSFIDEPRCDEEIMEGSSIELKYQLSVHNCVCTFYKNDKLLKEKANVKKLAFGYFIILEITNVTLKDAGTYCLVVSTRKSAIRFRSNSTTLSIKKTRDMHLKCHTFTCNNLSVYKCFDCKTVYCGRCKHHWKYDFDRHLIQRVSDIFILNYKHNLEMFIRDIKVLSNGLVIVAGFYSYKKNFIVLPMSVSGAQKEIIPIRDRPRIMDVLGYTVAVVLENKSVAKVDTKTNSVEYVNINIEYTIESVIYIKNMGLSEGDTFYIGREFGITVIDDKSGREIDHIPLSFTPGDMCYAADLQRIYCINKEKSKLICINTTGQTIFTFANRNWTELQGLTINNEGNVLVLCKQAGVGLGCVIKINCNDSSSVVVITHTPKVVSSGRISFHGSSNSVLIQVDENVYIYKEVSMMDTVMFF